MRVGSSQEYKQDSTPAYFYPTIPDSRQVASIALEQTLSSQPQLLLTFTATEDSSDQRCSELHGCSKPDGSSTRIWSEEPAWCKRAGKRPEVAGTGCAAGDA